MIVLQILSLIFLFYLAAVILPTLWLYLEHRFDAEQWFFGVVFAAFCFTNLLASPLFGFWVDYTQKTKAAILFANLFEIGGKLKYGFVYKDKLAPPF